MSGREMPPDRVPAGDYLWDRSGADEDVMALERVLGGLKHRGEMPRDVEGPARQHPLSRRRRIPTWLAAAIIVLSVAGAWIAVLMQKGTNAGWVQTGSGESAMVRNGLVELGEESRALVLGGEKGPARVRFAWGSVRVHLAKSPEVIEVAMPIGTARVSAGTECSLVWRSAEGPMPPGSSSQGEGVGGRVDVDFGRVEFAEAERVVRVGEACTVELGERSIGTPRRYKSAPRFVELMKKMDGVLAEGRQPPESFVEEVMAASGKMDGVTLWNLLWRLDEPGRRAVAGRVRVLWPEIAGLEEALRRRQEGALEKAWGVVAR